MEAGIDMDEPTLATENWLPVVEWERSHEVSDLGRVRSLTRTVPARRSSGLFTKTIYGRIISPYVDKKGYGHLHLYHERVSARLLVHRVVLEAFRGTPPIGMQGCHNNGQPDDNRLVNLRWDTCSENNLDVVRHGRHYQANKEECPFEHKLVAPNLMPNAKGRVCLSCSRAKAARSRAQRDNRPFDYRAVSDHYYAVIMASPTGVAPRYIRSRA